MKRALNSAELGYDHEAGGLQIRVNECASTALAARKNGWDAHVDRDWGIMVRECQVELERLDHSMPSQELAEVAIEPSP